MGEDPRELEKLRPLAAAVLLVDSIPDVTEITRPVDLEWQLFPALPTETLELPVIVLAVGGAECSRGNGSGAL